MFVLRCLFWLGLVFSQIAQLEGNSASSLVGQAARGAGGQAAALGQSAAQAAGKQCQAEPAKCLALTSEAARIAQTAGLLRKGDGDASGRDTLTAADRLPSWRDSRSSDRKL
jgi:hypothetical protein